MSKVDHLDHLLLVRQVNCSGNTIRAIQRKTLIIGFACAIGFLLRLWLCLKEFKIHSANGAGGVSRKGAKALRKPQ